MPKLFHREEWYHGISPTSMLEAEFEHLLMQHSSVLREDAWLLPFKKTVRATDSTAQADLALISRNYRDWTVIEVEMNRHSLHNHVIPQVRTLKTGLYGPEHADYLASKEPELDREKLYDVMRGEDPSVLVIVDRPDPEWARELVREGAQLVVFEIFRSEKLQYIFSLDGEIKTGAEHVLSELTPDPFLPNMVVVGSPAMLGFASGERKPIFFEGFLSEWERIDIRTNCYITTTGQMPLKKGMRYALVMNGDGRHEIVEHRRK